MPACGLHLPCRPRDGPPPIFAPAARPADDCQRADPRRLGRPSSRREQL